MITEALAQPPFPASLVFQDVDPAILEAEDLKDQPTERDAWATFVRRMPEDQGRRQVGER